MKVVCPPIDEEHCLVDLPPYCRYSVDSWLAKAVTWKVHFPLTALILPSALLRHRDLRRHRHGYHRRRRDLRLPFRRGPKASSKAETSALPPRPSVARFFSSPHLKYLYELLWVNHTSKSRYLSIFRTTITGSSFGCSWPSISRFTDSHLNESSSSLVMILRLVALPPSGSVALF